MYISQIYIRLILRQFLLQLNVVPRHAIGSYEPQGNGRKILTGILIVGVCLTVVVVILRLMAGA